MDFNTKRRRHSRCAIDTTVTYSLFNKEKKHQAIARNYSRSGIYFETVMSLSPGTLVLIRYGRKERTDVSELPTIPILSTDADAEACHELKMQVVGEVKRCERLTEGIGLRYGIAVRYVSPAV